MKVFLLSLLVCRTLFATSQDFAPSAEQIRGMIEGQIKSFNINPEPVFRIQNTSIWNGTDSIKIRIYYPKQGKSLPAIFNIHGGALVAGNLDSHENISRLLCSKTNSVVIALDYRRPPESPYPAGLNDTWLVMKWIADHATDLGIAKDKIIVTSDSGGGLFAAALPKMIKKEKSKIKIQGMVFINPAIDLRTDSAAPVNPVYRLVTGWYLGTSSPDDSLASPIIGSDFSMFAPSLVVVCEKDELKPQGEQLAQKLKDARIKVELFNVPKEDHYGGYWAAAHPRAKPAIDQALQFIARLRR